MTPVPSEKMIHILEGTENDFDLAEHQHIRIWSRKEVLNLLRREIPSSIATAKYETSKHPLIAQLAIWYAHGGFFPLKEVSAPVLSGCSGGRSWFQSIETGKVYACGEVTARSLPVTLISMAKGDNDAIILMDILCTKIEDDREDSKRLALFDLHRLTRILIEMTAMRNLSRKPPSQEDEEDKALSRTQKDDNLICLCYWSHVFILTFAIFNVNVALWSWFG